MMKFEVYHVDNGKTLRNSKSMNMIYDDSCSEKVTLTTVWERIGEDKI